MVSLWTTLASIVEKEHTLQRQLGSVHWSTLISRSNYARFCPLLVTEEIPFRGILRTNQMYCIAALSESERTWFNRDNLTDNRRWIHPFITREWKQLSPLFKTVFQLLHTLSLFLSLSLSLPLTLSPLLPCLPLFLNLLWICAFLSSYLPITLLYIGDVRN